MERTLVLIKPDAMQRSLAFKILSRIEERGFRITGLKLVQIDRTLAERYYGEHIGKGFFESMVSYITASPVIVAVFEGTNVTEALRNTIGKPNPRDAAPGTIRGDLGIEIGRNLVHASDSIESAERETSIFFAADELLNYKRVIDPMVFE